MLRYYTAESLVSRVPHFLTALILHLNKIHFLIKGLHPGIALVLTDVLNVTGFPR